MDTNLTMDNSVKPEDYVLDEARIKEQLSEVPNEPEASPLSERDYKIAYAKAVKERKEKLKQNKDMVSDMELEVSYWKAQSDLLKYRFEKMDYYMKNIELEPRYLAAIEEKKEREIQDLVDSQKPILD